MFDGAVDTRDLVTWNSLLATYLVHNKEAIAFKLFMDMRMFFAFSLKFVTISLMVTFPKQSGKIASQA